MYMKYVLYVILVIFTYLFAKKGLIPLLKKWIAEATQWSKDGKEMFGKEQQIMIVWKLISTSIVIFQMVMQKY